MKPQNRGGRGHYQGRPDFKSRGSFDRSNERGRGGQRGSRRGERGGRGRGGPRYETAGPVNEADLETRSDEEVVLLDADEMLLVEDMKRYVRDQLKNIITEE